MNVESVGFTWVIVAIMMAVLACSGVVLLAVQLRQLRQEATRRTAMYASLHKTVKVLSKEILMAGKSRQSVESQLKQLRIRQAQIESNGPEARPYSHAIAMVKKGAKVVDLMAVCGLSQGEAELIATIHGMHHKPKLSKKKIRHKEQLK